MTAQASERGQPPRSRGRNDARRNVLQPMKGRKLVAIASGKGGVGKTWFAITLCHALARRGRRCLLFDGDLGLANVDIQLGLMPPYDLGSVIGGSMTLGDATFDYPLGGFKLIAGLAGSGVLSGLSQRRLLTLGGDLLRAAAGYDHVIVDIGAGIEAPVRALTGPAARCLVVVTEEPTALTDAYAFIKLTLADFPATRFRIVVNMASSRTNGERTYESLLRACRSFLGHAPPLAGVVRRDARVADSIRQQTPLLTRYPQSEAGADVEVIAHRLIADATP